MKHNNKCIKIQVPSAQLSSVIIEWRIEIYGRFLVLNNIAPGMRAGVRVHHMAYGLVRRVVHKMQLKSAHERKKIIVIVNYCLSLHKHSNRVDRVGEIDRASPIGLSYRDANEG